MPVLILQVKMEIEGVEKICWPEDYYWCMDVKKSNGDDVRERITVCKTDKEEIPNTKNATCNFMMKWEDDKQFSSELF